MALSYKWNNLPNKRNYDPSRRLFELAFRGCPLTSIEISAPRHIQLPADIIIEESSREEGVELDEDEAVEQNNFQNEGGESSNENDKSEPIFSFIDNSKEAPGTSRPTGSANTPAASVQQTSAGNVSKIKIIKEIDSELPKAPSNIQRPTCSSIAVCFSPLLPCFRVDGSEVRRSLYSNRGGRSVYYNTLALLQNINQLEVLKLEVLKLNSESQRRIRSRYKKKTPLEEPAFFPEIELSFDEEKCPNKIMEQISHPNKESTSDEERALVLGEQSSLILEPPSKLDKDSTSDEKGTFILGKDKTSIMEDEHFSPEQILAEPEKDNTFGEEAKCISSSDEEASSIIFSRGPRPAELENDSNFDEEDESSSMEEEQFSPEQISAEPEKYNTFGEEAEYISSSDEEASSINFSRGPRPAELEKDSNFDEEDESSSMDEEQFSPEQISAEPEKYNTFGEEAEYISSSDEEASSIIFSRGPRPAELEKDSNFDEEGESSSMDEEQFSPEQISAEPKKYNTFGEEAECISSSDEEASSIIFSRGLRPAELEKDSNFDEEDESSSMEEEQFSPEQISAEPEKYNTFGEEAEYISSSDEEASSIIFSRGPRPAELEKDSSFREEAESIAVEDESSVEEFFNKILEQISESEEESESESEAESDSSADSVVTSDSGVLGAQSCSDESANDSHMSEYSSGFSGTEDTVEGNCGEDSSEPDSADENDEERRGIKTGREDCNWEFLLLRTECPVLPESVSIRSVTEGIILSWDPSVLQPYRKIERYSVSLGVRSGSTHLPGTPAGTVTTMTSLADRINFQHFYCGPKSELLVPNELLQRAHLDTRTIRPAIIFRIIATDENGFGSAVDIRWVTEKSPTSTCSFAKVVNKRQLPGSDDNDEEGRKSKYNRIS